MELKTILSRARRGLREDRRLYVVAISSLTVAFLCLGAALLVMGNLSVLAERWSSSGRLTIYLHDGASAEDVQQLRVLVENLPEAASVEHLTAAQAREQFLDNAHVDGALGGLPPEAFPASLEVSLAAATPVQRVDAISARVARFGVVDDVETYRGWFERLDALLVAGRGVAGALALLVVVCVLAVVGNTIRLAVAGRREEIEVMKLCGATDGFVRGPFVAEGAFQGFVAAAASLLLLSLAFVLLRGKLDSTIALLTGHRTVFLHPVAILALVLGGALAGAAGSALSLRRYLTV